MISNMKSLIGKLNQQSRKALEKAAEYCVSQTNTTVEIEHLLTKILEDGENDVTLILKYYEINLPLLKRQLAAAIEKFPKTAGRTPTLSPHLLTLIENAWMLSSIERGEGEVRSGTLLLSLLSTDILRGIFQEENR